MPYVERGPDGKVRALYAEPDNSAAEFLQPDSDEISEFLLLGGVSQAFPLIADLKMIRVIEDLIDLLIAKNVILFTELPTVVQDKILAQKSHREKLFGSSTPLIVDDETPLF